MHRVPWSTIYPNTSILGSMLYTYKADEWWQMYVKIKQILLKHWNISQFYISYNFHTLTITVEQKCLYNYNASSSLSYYR